MRTPTRISRKKTITIATACMMSLTPSFAQEDDDLDLAALFDLNMEVTVASKKAEKVSDAPGMIVAYSEKDIKNMGYYTVADLANQTTGFSSYYIYGEKVLESRGQKAGSFNNNKHLLLVDGIPVHNARNFKAPTEEEMPIFAAQRVEFMKGPGSALYGTGAFYGVISVVPKTLKENGAESKAMMTVSSEDFSKRVMANSIVKKDAGELNITASYFDKEASNNNTLLATKDAMGETTFDGFTGGDTLNPKQLDYDDRNAQFLNISYKLSEKSLKGLGIGFIYTRKAGGLGENWGGPSHLFNSICWQTAIPYVKFQRDFSDRFSINSYLKGNYSTEQGQGTGFEYQSDVADGEILLEGSWDFGNAGTLISGFNYDLRKELSKDNNVNGGHEIAWGVDSKTKEYTDHTVKFFSPSLLFHTISAYAQYQIEFPILSGLKLTAGVRSDNGVSKESKDAIEPNTGATLDREGNTFHRVSPRAGIVQKFTDKINAKLLYGSAIRSPGIKEFGLIKESRDKITEAGANTVLKDVTAEVISTLEGSVNLTLQQLNVSVAGYYNVTKDALDGYSMNVIGSDGTTKKLNVFGNSSDPVKGAGAELDIQAMPLKEIKILAGASYGKTYSVKTNDSTGVVSRNQQYGVPTGKINAAVSYNHSNGYKFGITPELRYYLGYRMDGDAEKSDKELKDNHKITAGYAVLDLNVQLPVNDNFGFEIMGRNLTNTAFYQPSGNKLFDGDGNANPNPKIKSTSVGVSIIGQF